MSQGQTGQLLLTVRNANNDDYQACAGDGIDDAWQVQYFGAPSNPNAGPTVDVSGTDQNNLFKFIAGLNPLDSFPLFSFPAFRFTVKAQPVAGFPAQRNIVFLPLVAGRVYVVR